MHEPPRLLVVAHGTASVTGRATTERLVRSVADARPGHRVDLAFLDVLDPRLAQSLDDRPTVVVPLLLSTGYHVQSDIPAAVAPFADTRVARHLGPHPLLVDALLDREPDPWVLVAAGSSRPEAAAELAATVARLADRVGHPVASVTMGEDLDAFFAARPDSANVATYLLAEGTFVDRIRAAAGRRRVGRPLGVHPGLVELVWQRYDETARGVG